jgi:hypothetical protein
MSAGSSLRRLAVGVSIALLVVSIIGFVGTLILNAFFLDDYNAYGEVPIPGESTLHLPAGPVTVSFHTEITGSTSGGGLPVPDMSLNIGPPAGVAAPKVTESIGGTTSVNNDVHRQVWTAQIPVAGDYDITTDGKVGPFINPTLAFGHDSTIGWLVWVFVGLFVVSLTTLIAVPLLARRTGGPTTIGPYPRTTTFGGPAFGTGYPAPPSFGTGYPAPPSFGNTVPPNFDAGPSAAPSPAAPHFPGDDGAKIEQLKTLAALRESGALTEEEFQTEKRRVLGT